jgi:hypothetical protein
MNIAPLNANASGTNVVGGTFRNVLEVTVTSTIEKIAVAMTIWEGRSR